MLIGQFGPAIICRWTLCVCSAWITETECVFYSEQKSKFRAASFRPTLIGNACKACHSPYNAHLFSCLVCIKEQREVVDVLLSETIRRAEASQSKQSKETMCVLMLSSSCYYNDVLVAVSPDSSTSHHQRSPIWVRNWIGTLTSCLKLTLHFILRSCF